MRMPSCRRAPRGAVGVLVIVALAMLLAFLSTTMNLGHVASVKGQLQSSGDSGALAGADVLDGTTPNVMTARTTATTLAGANKTDGTNVVVPLGEAEAGHWDTTTKAFSARDPATQANEIQAIRVTTYRDSTHAGGAVALFLGEAIGGGTARTVAARAVAVGGTPSRVVNAELPIAMSDCALSALDCDKSFDVALQSTPEQDACWTGFSGGTNTPSLLSLVTGAGDGSGITLTQGDVINLTNGTVTPVCNAVANLSSSHPGHKWIVPVISTGCPPPCVHSTKITSFVYIELGDPAKGEIVCNGGNKHIKVTLRCNLDAPPGATPGGNFNPSINPMPPALVQ